MRSGHTGQLKLGVVKEPGHTGQLKLGVVKVPLEKLSWGEVKANLPRYHK